MPLYDKKPTLSDYGLTKDQVDKNNYAKTHRQSIIRENSQIEENARKYGVTAFVIGFILSAIIGGASGSSTIGVVMFLISIFVGVMTNYAVKSTVKQVPTFSQTIDDKYKRYLKALEQWELRQAKNKQISTTTSIVQSSEPKKTTTKTTSKSATKTNSTKSPTKSVKQENVEPIKATKLTKKSEPKPDYQVGMVVKHNTFGIGKILKVSDDKKEIYVRFDDTLQHKIFLTDIAKFEILETPKPVLPKEETKPTLLKPVETPKPEISITYPISHISLTKEQEQIFNQMLDISLKFCVDLQIDDRAKILGVGLKEQEKLRYYLSERAGKVYVKFTDVMSPVLLDTENKLKLISLTRDVNSRFEENPEKYQLYSYKSKQEQEITKPQDTNSDIDIFDIDEDTSQLPTTQTETNEESQISYNKSLFVIENTSLIRCVGVSRAIDYEIPNGITIIEENAFLDNKFLHNLTIPESVTVIKDQAFKNCSNLKNLVLPSSITSIGKNVFDGCSNLETLFCQTKAVKKLLIDLPKHIEIVCLEF